MTKKNPVEESLKQLDLKGLLFLNMLVTERALTLIHEKETVMNKLNIK